MKSGTRDSVVTKAREERSERSDSDMERNCSGHSVLGTDFVVFDLWRGWLALTQFV